MAEPPFGRIAASALVKAAAWATHHDAAVALFFATLDRLEAIDEVLSAADLALALAATPPGRGGHDIATLAAQAQADAAAAEAPFVTPLNLIHTAANAAGPALDAALTRVGVERSALIRALEPRARIDDLPPPAARYVVVVRGSDFLDASNSYETLNDAKRARAALRERAFGIPIGMRDRSDPTPFWLRIPERIAEATDVSIRDLEAGSP